MDFGLRLVRGEQLTKTIPAGNSVTGSRIRSSPKKVATFGSLLRYVHVELSFIIKFRSSMSSVSVGTV